MAKGDMIRFRELLNADTEFQEKLMKAADAYTGEQNEKAVFEGLLLPLAQEYGLTATYDEFREYVSAFTAKVDSELSEDELAQIAGGKGGGLGVNVCVIVGVGIGGGGGIEDNNFGYGACILIGAGLGKYSCAGSGEIGDL